MAVFSDQDMYPVLQKLQDAGIVPPDVRRVVIDIEVDSEVLVYYESLATQEMVRLAIEELIAQKRQGAEIKAKALREMRRDRKRQSP